MAADHQDIDIAPFIDHSLLMPIATLQQVQQWCEEADRFGFAAVCINPAYVRQAVEFLHGKNPKVCTVIGFPSGAVTTATKLYEAQEAVDNGATELDMVINLGWLKSGETEKIHREIAEICAETGQLIKVILETTLLTDAEKVLGAEIAMDAGAQFLKTSTGWNGGATVDDIRLLKEVAKDRVGIKASGGIRTSEQALDLIVAGATRIGTSNGVEILRQRDISKGGG
jgi:deoxyribose-phosphate aldolase